MKKLSLIAIACLAGFAFQACNDSSPDAVKSANESNEVKQDAKDSAATNAIAAPVSETDSKFAVKAAGGGMTEVQLGELAQQKAHSQRVKDFGKMMVQDHTAAGNDLKGIAGRKNITLPVAPSDDQMDHIKDLSKKSGKEFDKAYMKMMVSDHKDVLDDFEKVNKDGTDPDIKAFASKTIPVIRTHLDSAKAIVSALK